MWNNRHLPFHSYSIMFFFCFFFNNKHKQPSYWGVWLKSATDLRHVTWIPIVSAAKTLNSQKRTVLYTIWMHSQPAASSCIRVCVVLLNTAPFGVDLHRLKLYFPWVWSIQPPLFTRLCSTAQTIKGKPEKSEWVSHPLRYHDNVHILSPRGFKYPPQMKDRRIINNYNFTIS